MLRKLKDIRINAEQSLLLLRSQYSIQILGFLFKQIKFTTTKFINDTGVNSGTAWSLLQQMEDLGIVEMEQRGSGRSPTIYRFKDLYQMVEEISV